LCAYPEEAIMAGDEVLARMRRDLEDRYGVEGAAHLMDRPRGGWDSLATKDELEATKQQILAELHKELREQTWRLTIALMATITAMSAILRFG
jgi:hypothetical protein